MSPPIVSVLIPAYNAERYVSAAIESVLAQSFEDWELIICDDGSTDGTLQIARSFENAPKIRVMTNARNIGQFPTHNLLAQAAAGKYIKYLHADDLLYPHCLEMMVHFMEYFADAAIGLSTPPRDWEILPIRLEPREAIKRHFFGYSPVGANAPTDVIIRRDAFWKHGPFGTMITEDTFLFAKLCLHRPCVLIPSQSTWYRPGGQVSALYLFPQRADLWEGVKCTLQLLADPACPLDTAEKQKALRNLYIRVSGEA